MELAASMPSDLKIHNGTRKWVLKQLFESRLPDRLVHRRKQGFELPVDLWLRGPLRSQIQELVLNLNGPLAEFISIPKARQLFAEHCNGRGRHGQLLWSLLILGRWLQSWGAAKTISRPKRVAPAQRSYLPMGAASEITSRQDGPDIADFVRSYRWTDCTGSSIVLFR